MKSGSHFKNLKDQEGLCNLPEVAELLVNKSNIQLSVSSHTKNYCSPGRTGERCTHMLLMRRKDGSYADLFFFFFRFSHF